MELKKPWNSYTSTWFIIYYPSRCYQLSKMQGKFALMKTWNMSMFVCILTFPYRYCKAGSYPAASHKPEILPWVVCLAWELYQSGFWCWQGPLMVLVALVNKLCLEINNTNCALLIMLIRLIVPHWFSLCGLWYCLSYGVGTEEKGVHSQECSSVTQFLLCKEIPEIVLHLFI